MSSVVELQGVSKVFTGRRGEQSTVLADVNLSIAPSEFVSIVGKSGCGKTTLLRIIAGLIPPSSGTSTVKGQPALEEQRRMGMVFQKPVLLPWRNALKNVLLPLEFRGRITSEERSRARDMLRLVSLGDAEKKFPHELSGGMQQRVAIARALASHPELLLMDEPFGALDAMTRDTLNVELQRIWMEAGSSAVFITHSISEAIFLSDRVIVMGNNPGHIAQEIRIELPRPRTRESRYSDLFRSYEAQISELIGTKGAIS